jgi:ATP/maltotriose-dependent transcriptional regulator MalT
LERINRGFQRRVILDSAPAGYGKTPLVSSWLLEIGDWRLNNYRLTPDQEGEEELNR